MDFLRRIFGQPDADEGQGNTNKSDNQSVPQKSSSDTMDAVDTAPIVHDKGMENKETAELIGSEKIMVDEQEAPANITSSPEGATRPLPPEKVMIGSEQLDFGMSTDVGMVRNNNQDAGLTFFNSNRSSEDQPDFGIFLVADGMGGHQYGEKASAITTRIFSQHVINNIFMSILSIDEDIDRPPIIEVLIEAVQKANGEVVSQVKDGGTTLTAVTIIGDLAHIVHVGDSRAYLATKDGIEQITRDHSLVQRMIEVGQITPEEAVDHDQGNILYRAIGMHENLEVDTMTRRLPADSRVIICSDGLWGHVNSEEIHSIVMENPPQTACDKLIALANTRGGKDNITTVVLKIPK